MLVYNTTFDHGASTVRTCRWYRPAEVPNSLSRTEKVRYNYDDCGFELKQRLQQARDNRRGKNKSKAVCNRTAKHITVHIGDKVLTILHTKKGKLSGKWQRPFEVIGHGKYNYSEGGRKEVKVHTNEAKLFNE
ncbi:Hypothetical protein CINCED_3A007530 [Cinara cedri]|uniref:Uncharacterized protein n=1 Tax=Cinara cedri TaxID=506608 RepID=A0A5E4MV43_9HEMI|nr:Hypothetical protein CINCED_3A007530 [Cinara cedri]